MYFMSESRACCAVNNAESNTVGGLFSLGANFPKCPEWAHTRLKSIMLLNSPIILSRNSF